MFDQLAEIKSVYTLSRAAVDLV